MGLLDIAKDALKGGEAGAKNPLMEAIMQMLANPKTGGLQELAKSFQDSGLGQQISSWVGTGSNLPISADQIKGVFDSAQLGQIASKLGLTENETAGGLADIMPKLIDKLTPNGEMPEGDMLSKGLGILKGKLFS